MDWILLRGLTREQGHWGDFPQRLQAAFPDQRFHPVDMPGTGVHFRESSPDTITGIREAVRRQVQHIPKPFSILALSMGGMVALDWAQHAPEGEIQNLVLINTSSGFSPFWQRMRPGTWPRLLRMLSRRELFYRERDLLRLTSNRQLPLELVKQWYRIQRQRPVSASNAWRQLKAATRYRPGQKRPLSDALLLASRGDRLVHWKCSSALEQRWQWTLRVHHDAGHDLAIDEPDWIVRELEAWLIR
ncbi:alpha/beta fold hydrolase [Marinobacter sp. F4206]|uniref:alpha/beta fold hydrolase n=1 Tax=Marinobacter sp. F4206 TaxID=2861777 RepID=UPI001C5CE5DB|nr:alpha/beta hydrolase [Marinobacter sp. F4206]MBW4934637.1 alpha/beta hydrolase [Marinobacter sp. F4206]